MGLSWEWGGHPTNNLCRLTMVGVFGDDREPVSSSNVELWDPWLKIYPPVFLVQSKTRNSSVVPGPYCRDDD